MERILLLPKQFHPKEGLKAFALILSILLFVSGCATLQKKAAPSTAEARPSGSASEDGQGAGNETADIEIREFILSPDDEISITVYGHDELSRTLKIPPDGKFYYPNVGTIEAAGRSLEELRKIITEGLARYREQTLEPGDEISITVFGHEELTRTITVPSDGKIFYPLVGTIDVMDKTVARLREIITQKLSEYRKFSLSPGDEISISVYGHEELSRRLIIPPDGNIYYPLVGTIEVGGKTPEEVRKIITEGLSRYREEKLLPGDEISISVYGHEELSRRLIIPPDGNIYYPLVGTIEVGGKTPEEVREIITEGLSRYREEKLLPGDEISISVYRQEDLDRKILIPPDGYIFFPLVGEIKAEGMRPSELRRVITDGLAKTIEDPQVSVDVISFGAPRVVADPQVSVDIISSSSPKALADPQVSVEMVSFGTPKIVVDPQVAVDITRLSAPKTVYDPQVSIEVTNFGGQKVYVLGEVKHPGVFAANGNMSLVEAISMAGGLTLDGNDKTVLLVRTGGQGPQPMVVDLERALTKGDMTQNPVLRRGDIVYVPRTYISNVDRFFEHLSTIIKPLINIETGYWLGQNIEAGPRKGGISITPR